MTPRTTCRARCSRSGGRKIPSNSSSDGWWTAVCSATPPRRRPGKRLASMRSTRVVGRSPTRCRTGARSRRVSMPTKTDTDGVTYLEAIGQAMMSEMEADPDVFLIGEDVGQFGGAFKVTKGFLEKFGPRRVVDTPIADFISCAFDPIINVLARHHYRTGDAMPVTMRAPFGARLRAGPTHSQSVESYFAHVPGLKIVMPGTPQDAAGLLISAIRDNNPVLYLENKYLYRRLRSDGPINLDPIPLGQAKVVREGRDITLITYSAGVSQGVEIADELAKDGISVEVIDIRTLVP